MDALVVQPGGVRPLGEGAVDQVASRTAIAK
jgi:hypothetical protein